MDALLKNFQDQFKKSQGHLEYSFLKVKKMALIHDKSTEEDLETWESFSSRFARSSDILVSKLLRKLILTKDPAFRGSVIDLLNQAEKFGWIVDADTWKRIRELRNVAAYEYAVDDLQELYQELIALTPHILRVNIHEPL
jgi:hypothetical protein